MSFKLLKSGLNRFRCSQLLSSAIWSKHSPLCWTRPIVAQQILQKFQSTSTLPNLSSTELGKTKEDLIYEALQTDLQVRRRVHGRGLEEFLRLTPSLTTEQLLFLLRCPVATFDEGFEKRHDLLKRIWEKRPTNVPESVEIAYMEACRDVGLPMDFIEFITEDSSRQALQAGLETAAQLGNLHQANAILSKIKERFTLDEAAFAAIIRCHTRTGQFEQIRGLLDTMDILNIERTTLTHLELFEAYAVSKPEEAKNLLREKISTLNPDQLLRVLLVTMENEADPETISFILKHFQSEYLSNQQMDPVFRNITSHIILQEKFSALETLLKLLPTPKFQANEDTDVYASNILEEMVKWSKDSKNLLKVCELLTESEKNTRALHVALGFALKQNSTFIVDLLKALSTKEQLRAHYFWPLMVQSSIVNGEIGLLDTLKLMKVLKVEIDVETISIYVLPKLNLTLKNAEKGVKQLEEHGIKTAILFTPLISTLLFQQRYNEVLFLNSLYPTKIDTETLIYPLLTTFTVQKGNQNFMPTFARLLKALKDKAADPKHDLVGHFMVELTSNPKTRNDHLNAVKLALSLNQQKLKMSRGAAKIVVNHFGKFITEEAEKKMFYDMVDKNVDLPHAEMTDNNHIKHPREMNYDEMECHLIELQSKGLNTRGLLRRLLQTCVREGRLERALEVKKECDSLKVDYSPGMLACTFDLFIRTKRAEDATNALRKLNQRFPGFLVDEHKIVDFATLLLTSQSVDEAKKFIRLRAQSAKIKGGDNIKKNIWNLLNELSNLADPKNDKNETKELFMFMNSLGYCTYHNSILGPVIKEYLNKNDLRGAVTEFKSLCQKHRVTPLQRQLMTVLVDVSNNAEMQAKFRVTQDEARELLQEIITAGSSIHGATNTNITLIVAFAEAGTDKQLRKMLIDPKVRISPEVLRKQCEYLNANKKLDALLKLARCSRGLGHFREQEVYNMILDTLVKENDCEGAMTLFDSVSSDDEFKISQEFVKKLEDLLKKNNLEVPTSVALQSK